MSSTDYISLNNNNNNNSYINMGGSCYDVKSFGDKPRFHWIIWCSGFFGILLLIFALLLDSITLARFESPGTAVATGLEYKMSCGWNGYDGKSRGYSNELYTICNGVKCSQQFTAGKLWLAFGILACIPIPLFLFGFYNDYFDGIIGGTKPIDYFKWWCCCQNLGFTLTALMYTFIAQTFMLFLYIFTSACGKEELWDEATVAPGRVNFRSLGGPSMAFAWMSWLLVLSVFIQIIVYQYTISAELPTAKPKENKIKLPEIKSKEPKPKPTPNEATGQAPDDEYFKPKSNVTNQVSSGEGVSNHKSSKPSGPPPVPAKKQRPTGLPPKPN